VLFIILPDFGDKSILFAGAAFDIIITDRWVHLRQKSGGKFPGNHIGGYISGGAGSTRSNHVPKKSGTDLEV